MAQRGFLLDGEIFVVAIAKGWDEDGENVISRTVLLLDILIRGSLF